MIPSSIFVKQCPIHMSRAKYVLLEKKKQRINYNCIPTSLFRKQPLPTTFTNRPLPTDLYQQEAFRQLSNNSFYCKVEKDLTPSNQKIVKETVHDLISKQKLPSTAQNLIITTPRTPVIYFKPKIHKLNNPGRPIVSAYSYPTELISQYLDQIMSPFVKSLPSYIKDTNHALKTFCDFQAKTNSFSLWT